MRSGPFLVTGAAGFIGSHSVDRLLDRGVRVVGIDDLSSGRRGNLAVADTNPNFKFIHGDVCDEAAMVELFRRYQFAGVLHLAALVSVPRSFAEPDLNARLNLYAVDSLARLCVRFGCERIVFSSSAAVYGNTERLPNKESDATHPLSPYASAKLASEVMLLGYAESQPLDVVCFRYFNVYGSRQDPGSPYSGVLSIFAERFQSSAAVTVHGDGEQTRDFVAVRDVARANASVLTADQSTTGRYNVCTGRAVSLNEVLRQLAKRYPDAPPPKFGPTREGDVRHSLGDPTDLLQVCGISAETSFHDGIGELLGGA